MAGVEDLASDHAFAAGGVGEFTQEFDGENRLGDAGGEEFEGEGIKFVAGEDGHGFTEDLVIGRAAAAEVIVVHGGEVIVDEGEAVDHFDGAGSRERAGGFGGFATDGGVAEKDEGRADAFAGAEKGVGGGFLEFGGHVLEGGEVVFEVGVGPVGGGGEEGFKVERA
jgi:hypothetical protein